MADLLTTTRREIEGQGCVYLIDDQGRVAAARATDIAGIPGDALAKFEMRTQFNEAMQVAAIIKQEANRQRFAAMRAHEKGERKHG